MSNRRTPLSSIPNAANSPYRATAAAATKRSRGEAGLQEDVIYEGQRSAKRQALEVKSSNFRTPPRKQPVPIAGDALFGKRSQNKKPTAFERKLLAAKDIQQSQKAERPAGEALEGIRTWQKHYRKVFPTFVFYFESVPDDIRSRCVRQIRVLGAREEKFFSKEVTHVVTTRALPSDSDTSPAEIETSSSKGTSSQPNGQPRTINPTLLSRQVGSGLNGQQQPSSKFSFETSMSKKNRPPARIAVDAEQKRPNTGNADILQRAHGMGMKIWQVEKLQRVITSMNEDPISQQSQHGRNLRGGPQVAGGKAAREDLSHMLRKEQCNGPSDIVSMEELVPFKGFHLYVRDMDEKTKPILMKEFPKPPRNESGDWPQFRATNPGKCPFVEDHSISRQDYERIKQQEDLERAKFKAERRAAPRTRAETAMENIKPEPIADPVQRQPLTESKNAANKSTATTEQLPTMEFCPPPAPALRRSPRKGVIEDPHAQAPKLFGGEPAASGLQPSNITSAIRSQMISSTAAVPGAKAGTSKEVHGLSRKVLEKNSGPALRIIRGPQPPTNMQPARAEHAIPATRQSRRRAQEKLVHIREESTHSGDEEDIWMDEEVQREEVVQRKTTKAKPKDSKPGYCENCREKYNDFDEHIISRKHRKFALTRDNWTDLDRLLTQLGRPLKEEYSDDY